jgi:hypothetical protein
MRQRGSQQGSLLLKTAVIGTITRMDENHPKIHDLYRDLVEVKISDSPSNSLYSCFSTIINLEIETLHFWKFICSLFMGVLYAWLTYNWTLKMPDARQLSKKERDAARLTQALYLSSTVCFCISVPQWYRYVCARTDRPKLLTMCSFCAQTSLHSGPACIVITQLSRVRYPTTGSDAYQYHLLTLLVPQRARLPL